MVQQVCTIEAGLEVIGGGGDQEWGRGEYSG